MNWTRLIFIVLMAVVAIAALIFYSSILVKLLLAIVLAYILDPLVTRLEFKRIPRWLAILLVYALIGGIIAWLSAWFIPRLIAEGNQFITLLGRTDRPISEIILELPFIQPLYEMLLKLDVNIPQMELAGKFVNFIESASAQIWKLPKLLFDNYPVIVNAIMVIFTIPIFGFFILNDKQKLRQAIVKLVPGRYFELALILLNKVDETVGRYMRAILLEMLSVSIMSTIALTIVGVPYAIVIGIIAGITNMVPYIGPWIGGIIAVLTVFLTGFPPIMAVWVALAMFIVQGLDNYIVYPTVIGKTIRMHPLLVLLTVLAGGYFGGVIWMLISVPLVFMVYSLVKELYINLKQFRLL
ncbi:MAG: AI-2E family transporter [Candidatus Syntrophosphaera sp.]|nr:AI-2E family transporter [Candidatus Syntrophosphaera sp.]